VAYLQDQLRRTETVLTAITGEPVCYFRPPGGFQTNVLAATKPQRVTVVMWEVDTLDWRQPGTTTAAATASIVTAGTRATGQAHPIVLMHSAKASHEPDAQVSPYRGNTVAALDAIITWYRSHGYRFVTLDGRS
jgi:peptidoglycan/xylan/chitin deacetylase (PgdA/CDA1 family)